MTSITCTAIRVVRSGELLAEGSITIGPVRVAGVRLIDRDGQLTVAMPPCRDRKHYVALSPEARVTAAAALHAALVALEGAGGGALGSPPAETYMGGRSAQVS